MIQIRIHVWCVPILLHRWHKCCILLCVEPPEAEPHFTILWHCRHFHCFQHKQKHSSIYSCLSCESQLPATLDLVCQMIIAVFTFLDIRFWYRKMSHFLIFNRIREFWLVQRIRYPVLHEGQTSCIVKKRKRCQCNVLLCWLVTSPSLLTDMQPSVWHWRPWLGINTTMESSSESQQEPEKTLVSRAHTLKATLCHRYICPPYTSTGRTMCLYGLESR